MEIRLDHIGKAYKKRWLYRSVEATFKGPGVYAILGENASGKSTLLRIIAGIESPNEGNVQWLNNGHEMKLNEYYRHFSLATPYQEIFEELSLREHIQTHFRFKDPVHQMSAVDFAKRIQLEADLDKSIKDFSSGMRQRLKVGLALSSDSALVLLDEPSTNLDKKGWNWYQELLREQAQKRLILVFSNYQEHEYHGSLAQIELKEFK